VGAEDAARKVTPLWRNNALLFVLIFVGIFLLHTPLLSVSYVWDEAGYYVPAARDLLTGSLIPQTTVSNAHPPLVMAWLALWWKIVGYALPVTRTAMLAIAAFTLLGVFRLAERVANTQVAIAVMICTAIYPVFFAQSSLVHLDLAAAGFTLWGLRSYIEDRRAATAIWFSLASVAKETAIFAPLALLAWELIRPVLGKNGEALRLSPAAGGRLLSLTIPALPLAIWFAYHYQRKGYVFGNPEFFQYNVAATLNPLRILLAGGLRVWQLTGYMHLWLLTLATALAMLLPPQKGDESQTRPRIAIPIQIVFLLLIVTYLAAMSMVGGAVLARYLLPVLPLGIVICVSTLWRRVRYWGPVVAVVVLAFAAALFVDPPYGFPFEDNLAYHDYAILHQNAERFLEARYPMARVLTAWPASDEITRPYLGYVTRPLRVLRIENFSLQELAFASEARSEFDVVLVFSTKYLPPNALVTRWPRWERLQTRFFGFHRDLPPEAVASLLGGQLVYNWGVRGQWVGIIVMERVYEANSRSKSLETEQSLLVSSVGPVSHLANK